jgi:hypothetical protein
VSAAPDGLADLKARLDRRTIPYESIPNGVRVAAASDAGFDATIRVDGERCRVGLGGWHEDFENCDDGVNCFVWALSSACRLAVTRRGFDHKWVLQAREGDAWRDDSVTGLLFFPFLLRGKTRYLQNEWWDGANSTAIEAMLRMPVMIRLVRPIAIEASGGAEAPRVLDVGPGARSRTGEMLRCAQHDRLERGNV